ncbi:MAG TPA: F0F1 ATP synthase subunit delta [Candidatus Paceibacterota bacterium]|nr:F0F1 ATP synthase subunit delta [Verrucomicrobiota bacterium]HSA12948.1 F0F1 ATP synthase subunit delta [Candidatus Paceibacterota bacterium]
MKTSKQARRDAKELFYSCRVDGLLDEAKVRQVVQRIIAAKPRGYFAILSHFQRLVRLDLHRRTARVESAVPLAEPQQAAIRTNLARRYGNGLIFAFSQNPGLIGGLRVQVGSDVFDGSVQARLARLEYSF